MADRLNSSLIFLQHSNTHLKVPQKYSKNRVLKVLMLEQRSMDSGENKKCPDCAELIKMQAKICKHCGKKF